MTPEQIDQRRRVTQQRKNRLALRRFESNPAAMRIFFRDDPKALKIVAFMHHPGTNEHEREVARLKLRQRRAA